MNLWLIGVSQSVSMGTSGVLAVQHFTRPVLWVWFCVRALFRWDNCAGRAAVLAMGILKYFFSKRKIQLQCINVSSSCLTLGKRNGCSHGQSAVCFWLGINGYKLPIDGWDPSVSRWNSTGAGEAVPHPSMQHSALGTTVTQTPQSLVVSHHLS